jgi:hypothetical protein
MHRTYRTEIRRIFQKLGETQVAFIAILSLGLLAMTARGATDPDLWWHLRTGQWIVETGHIPHVDPFSFTRRGQPWVAHEWLSEIVFYKLWKYLGFSGLIVFSAMITSAGFMLLYFRCPGKRHWAAGATVMGALASAPSWGVRPQMFTFTMACLLLWLIERGEERPRLLFWIPPLFLLWLNLHAGFALGPALLLAYATGLILEAAVGSTTWHAARPILLRVLLALLVCLTLIPLNPNGIQLYRYPFDTLRSHGIHSFIVEWASPDFHDWLYRPFLVVWLLLLMALASSRSRPRGRVFMPLLLTAFAALDAVRHIPIFVLLAMPIIASAIDSAQARSSPSAVAQGPRASSFRPVFYGAVVVLTAILASVKLAGLARNQQARAAKIFPEKAIAFLHARDYPQRVFVYYDWGGYAIWNLYPEYRVFVDGRSDLYADDILQQFTTLTRLRTGWQEVLDSWNINVVLLPASSALAQGLLLDPAWRTIFSDSKAIILIRGVGGHPAVENAVLSTKSMPKGLLK